MTSIVRWVTAPPRTGRARSRRTVRPRVAMVNTTTMALWWQSD